MTEQDLYKGYIEVKNGKPINKFKDGATLKTLEEVRNCEGYGGVLKDEIVMIDIDDVEEANICGDMMEDMDWDCFSRPTERGRHILFKNNGKFKKCMQGVMLACGLTADIKVGGRNTQETLKKFNKERQADWDTQGRDLMVAPVFMTPMIIKKDKTPDFVNMRKGDGRNATLYEYIIALKRNGFTKEQIKETIKVINKYVFAERLSDNEIDTITRDEAYDNIETTDFDADDFYNSKGRFLFDKFAKYMVKADHFINIGGAFYIYDDGVYKADSTVLETKMIEHISGLSNANRTEVYKYMKILRVEHRHRDDYNYIAFKNGILNLDTMELEEFSPDKVVRNMIPHNYNPDAECPIVDKAFDNFSCGDENIKALLFEAAGYTLYRSSTLCNGKSFLLTGEKGNNGKSTYLNAITYMLGDENTVSLDLHQLGDRFETGRLTGKLANIGDDIDDGFVDGKTVAVFKKSVTGERMKGEKKGDTSYDFDSYAKQFFSANIIPKMKDRGAVLRRLIIIPFNNHFVPGEDGFDPNLKRKLETEEAAEYLLKRAVESLKKLIETNMFTQSSAVDKQMEEYEEEIDPIKAWIKDTPLDQIEHESTTMVYDNYKLFCEDNQMKPYAKISFSKRVCKELSMTTEPKRVNGKLARVFEPKQAQA